MSEQKRGCGYRKIGGLYLVGGGRAVPCDFLPHELTTCRHCGAGVKQTRGFTWFTRSFFGGVACNETCDGGAAYVSGGIGHALRSRRVICPMEKPPETKFGLLWIGGMYYPTPEAFRREAAEQGISRRIVQIPRELRLGETWIFLAHPRCEFPPALSTEASDVADRPGGTPGQLPDRRFAPGIFYMFRPERVEKILTKELATDEELKNCEKRGITPVIVDDIQRHRAGKDDGQHDLPLTEEQEEPI